MPQKYLRLYAIKADAYENFHHNVKTVNASMESSFAWHRICKVIFPPITGCAGELHVGPTYQQFKGKYLILHLYFLGPC